MLLLGNVGGSKTRPGEHQVQERPTPPLTCTHTRGPLTPPEPSESGTTWCPTPGTCAPRGACAGQGSACHSALMRACASGRAEHRTGTSPYWHILAQAGGAAAAPGASPAWPASGHRPCSLHPGGRGHTAPQPAACPAPPGPEQALRLITGRSGNLGASPRPGSVPSSVLALW